MRNEKESGARRRRRLLALALVVLLSLLVVPLPVLAAEVEGGDPQVSVTNTETVAPPEEPAETTEPAEPAEPSEGTPREEPAAPAVEKEVPAEAEAEAPAGAPPLAPGLELEPAEEPAAAASPAEKTVVGTPVPAEAAASLVAPTFPPTPPEKPKIHLSKTGPDEAYPGQTVTYTITVKNTGDVELHGVTMYDNQINFSYDVGTLAVGASVTQYPTYTIPLDKEGVFPNNAEAKGYSPKGTQVVDNSEWHIRLNKAPCVELQKMGPDCAIVGEAITYEYLVTNTGGYCLANLTLTDDRFGDIATWDSLEPAASVSATYDAVVGEDWESPYVNVATVSAEATCGELDNRNGGGVIITASAEHSLEVLHPSISLDKSVNPATAAVGDTVTYTYVVTNTGDTELLNVVLTDDVFGAIGDWATIAAGDSETVTMTHLVVQADLPEITNVATVTATTPCETEVSATDTVTLPVTSGIPAGDISIVKSLVTTGTILEGDSVTFSFTITNTGQTDILAPVAVVDTYDAAMLSFKSASIAPTSAGGGLITWADVSGGAGMAPGDSVTVTVTFQALQAGVTTNAVTVSATDSEDTPLSSSGSDSVTINQTIPPSLPPSIIVTTPEVVVTAAAPSGVLPVTGGDFAGLLTAALILIPLGLFGLTAGVIRRKRSLRK